MGNEERTETTDNVEDINVNDAADTPEGPDLADEGKAPVSETEVEVEAEVIENAGEPEEEYLEPKQEQLSEEEETFRERYVRLLADFDNYRKRASKDLSLERQRGRRDAAERLLPVFDSLDMGLRSAKDDATRGGLTAVRTQLLQVFESLGIQKIETKGEKFDPELHEAIAHMASAEIAEGHITDESRAGFEDSVGLLRAPQVVVSSGESAE